MGGPAKSSFNGISVFIVLSTKSHGLGFGKWGTGRSWALGTELRSSVKAASVLTAQPSTSPALSVFKGVAPGGEACPSEWSHITCIQAIHELRREWG